MTGKLAFIQTGGTIDKDYPRKTKGYAFEIDEPAFRRVLDKLVPNFQYDYYEFCKKDSLEVTDEDRAALADFISQLDHSRVIITHGTDTMIETGQFLSGKIQNKAIVITGAKLPERFSNSDAPINLGVAIGAVSSQSTGVFVCMQGLIIPANHAYRDQEGNFYQG